MQSGNRDSTSRSGSSSSYENHDDEDVKRASKKAEKKNDHIVNAIEKSHEDDRKALNQ